MEALLRMMTSRLWLGVLATVCPAVWGLTFLVQEAGARGLVAGDDLLRGRDFMAFYMAGTLIRDSGEDPAPIYDRQLQQQAQDRILAPQRLDGLLYFINPASVAVVYSVLARLPYLPAFYLHVALMIACFAAGMRLLKAHLPSLRADLRIAAGLAIAWMPMAHTITGGQNAALCFMLWAAAYAATRCGRQGWAGLALGLLLFKPQYAVPLLGLLLLRGQWITCGVAGLVGAGHYALGAIYCGLDWPAQMAASLGGFYRAQERVVSGHSHIAFTEAVDYAIVQPLERAGWLKAAAVVRLACYAVVAAGVAYLVFRWRRARVAADDFGLYWALACAAALSISLHTQYYDGGMLILPVLLILDRELACGRTISSGWRTALVLIYILYPFVYVAGVAQRVGFQPLAVVPIVIAIWADRRRAWAERQAAAAMSATAALPTSGAAARAAGAAGASAPGAAAASAPDAAAASAPGLAEAGVAVDPADRNMTAAAITSRGRGDQPLTTGTRS